MKTPNLILSKFYNQKDTAQADQNDKPVLFKPQMKP